MKPREGVTKVGTPSYFYYIFCALFAWMLFHKRTDNAQTIRGWHGVDI